jgi:hypothetical protein
MPRIRKGTPKQPKITDAIETVINQGSPFAHERPIPHELIENRWTPECAGDRTDTMADLFRLLRRAAEYNVEADRQLRLDELTEEEQTQRVAWYKDMDAADEWTCQKPEGSAAAALSIIETFDNNPITSKIWQASPKVAP